MAIERSDEFNTWLKRLRDRRAKAKVLIRIERIATGNPGDVAPIGQGLSEMRIHHGPGYRIYYVERGGAVMLLLEAIRIARKATSGERRKFWVR
jgi:putative addiction module killer protein